MERLNDTCITQVAATVETMLGLPREEHIAPPLAGKYHHMDRVFLYNPDAIAEWVFEKYRDLFVPLLQLNPTIMPMRSVFPPITPVCFASMYSGLMPKEHGIMRYEKPVLKVKTIFDVLPEHGMKVAIVSTEGDSISKIFLGRHVDYFIYKSKQECNAKAMELIAQDRHQVIVLYNGDYDHYMHRHSPDGKRSLQALKENVDTYVQLHQAIAHAWKQHRTALFFAPDHGCHSVATLFGSHGLDVASDMNTIHFLTFLPETI